MKIETLLKYTVVSLVLLATTSNISTIANTGFKDTRIAANTKPNSNLPYTRVDFELHGSKCAACIRRLVKAYRKSKGVMKVDISIVKPFGGVIIFDHSLTNFERLKKRMKKEKVKPVNIQMKEIQKVPSIVIPESLMKKLKMRKKNKNQTSRKSH